MIIGAHVSTAGGVVKACERAGKMGCTGMQIFTGSPRVWQGKSVEQYSVEGLMEARRKYGIEYVVIHATYLVNLASDKPELVERSVVTLVNDLKIADKIAGECGDEWVGVVVHVGSHQGRGYETMREQMVEAMKRIMEGSPVKGRLLIENSAGQKGKIASELEEVGELIDGVGSPELGWCFDTCHGHAAGYVLVRNQKSKAKSQNNNSKGKISEQGSLFGDDEERIMGHEPRVMKGKSVVSDRVAVEEIGRLDLWERLWCVHVNGSRDELGSGRDRHANLGEGKLASEAIGKFLSEVKLKKPEMPLVLEVPGFDGKGPDEENVDLLKELVKR